MTYLLISDEELLFHLKAHDELSLRNSDKLLKGIPQETRAKMTKFYKMLRDDGIYYTPGEKPQRICTYLEGWKLLLEANPRSVGERVSQEQVATMLKESIKDVIQRMKSIS
jgi:hypothetical protein